MYDPTVSDPLFESISTRSRPELTMLYSRLLDQRHSILEGGMWQSLSMKTYAGWLQRRAGIAKGRVFRYDPSPVAMDSMTALGRKELDKLLSAKRKPARKMPGSQPILEMPSREKRLDLARELLQGWRDLLLSVRTKPLSTQVSRQYGSLLSDLLYYADTPGYIEALKIDRDSEMGQSSYRDIVERSVEFYQSLYSLLGRGGE